MQSFEIFPILVALVTCLQHENIVNTKLLSQSCPENIFYFSYCTFLVLTVVDHHMYYKH